MEGVLVTARQESATFDVTVVSDAKGRYSFPRSHLGAGRYTLKIRAVGYDLSSANTVQVPAGARATLDLTLDKTKDMSTKQLTSVEWLMTVPGTDEQKAMVQKQIQSCTYCHELERIFKSKHTAEQFLPVIDRMHRYFPDGSMAGTEGRGRARMDDHMNAMPGQESMWGFAPGVKKTDLANYLASVNLSGGRSLPSDYKTLPRPKGNATRVIITQYDLPRKDTVPHDSDVDSKGNVWYTDQSDYYVGVLDGKTGAIKEWPLPKATTHKFGGASDITLDHKDRPWFSVTSDKVGGNFGMPGRFDPQTGTWTPVEGLSGGSQFNAIGPDGTVVQGTLKIDADSMKVLDSFEWQKSPSTPQGTHVVYEPAMDSKGNWYNTDFFSDYIIQVEAKTKKVNWLKVPTVYSEPRRGRMDGQDRYWFGEFTGDKVAVLDTKTLKFREFPVGIKWSAPYTSSVPDAKGRVYSPSAASDRVFQVDPKTGEVVAFLMPTRDFDSKQVSIDPVSKRIVWLANTRNARMIKIEPLD